MKLMKLTNNKSDWINALISTLFTVVGLSLVIYCAFGIAISHVEKNYVMFLLYIVAMVYLFFVTVHSMVIFDKEMFKVTPHIIEEERRRLKRLYDNLGEINNEIISLGKKEGIIER